MKTPELVEWSLQWSNPYTNPPEGMPRVICQARMPRGEEPKDLKALHVLGGGYGIHLRFLDVKPVRQLSEKTKQSIRRKNLERRARANAPLFANAMIAQELETRPEYFGKK